MDRFSWFDKWDFICRKHATGADELGRPIDPAQPWLDSGDGAHRTAAYSQVKVLQGEAPVMHRGLLSSRFTRFIERATVEPGVYRRGCDEAFWYSAWDRMSRDLLLAMLGFLVTIGHREEIKRVAWALVKRGSFAANTRRNGATARNDGYVYNIQGDKRDYGWKVPDWCGPVTWTLLWRGLGVRPLYWVLDWWLLVDVLWSRAFGNPDPINQIQVLETCQAINPTWGSRLAYKLAPWEKLHVALVEKFTKPGEPTFVALEWVKYHHAR